MENIENYKVSKEKEKLYLERKSILKNKILGEKTLITNTCIGGRLYHDYNQKFLSPTIDLYIKPKDFVKFCCNLKEYLDYELLEDKNKKINNFVVAKLNDIYIYFSHTNYTFEIAKQSWERRKKRINYEDVIVIATDGCTIDEPLKRCDDITIQEFGKIPYKKLYLQSKNMIMNIVVFFNLLKKKDVAQKLHYQQ